MSDNLVTIPRIYLGYCIPGKAYFPFVPLPHTERKRKPHGQRGALSLAKFLIVRMGHGMPARALTQIDAHASKNSCINKLSCMAVESEPS